MQDQVNARPAPKRVPWNNRYRSFAAGPDAKSALARKPA
jgi:hypothetical protein